jgi:DNA-binding transcriptional regulator GbsR (MarR family)
MGGELTEKQLETKILESFATVAETIGYSPLHGKIIGVLLLEGGPVSLEEMAKKTGYSASMISLSIDFLELMEVIKRVKKAGDRKLYVTLNGDLLGILKKAIVMRVKKVLSNSINDFDESRKHLGKLSPDEKKRIEKAIGTLEKEIKKLDYYVNLLAQIELQ